VSFGKKPSVVLRARDMYARKKKAIAGIFFVGKLSSLA